MDEPLSELGRRLRAELEGWASGHRVGWLSPAIEDPGADLAELVSLEAAVVSLVEEEVEAVALFHWLTTGFLPGAPGDAQPAGGTEGRTAPRGTVPAESPDFGRSAAPTFSGSAAGALPSRPAPPVPFPASGEAPPARGGTPAAGHGPEAGGAAFPGPPASGGDPVGRSARTPAREPSAPRPPTPAPAVRPGLGGLADLAERIGSGGELLLDGPEAATPAEAPVGTGEGGGTTRRGFPASGVPGGRADADPPPPEPGPEAPRERVSPPFELPEGFDAAGRPGGATSAAEGSRGDAASPPDAGPPAPGGEPRRWRTPGAGGSGGASGPGGASGLPFSRPIGRAAGDEGAEPASPPGPGPRWPDAAASDREREHASPDGRAPRKRFAFGAPISSVGSAREAETPSGQAPASHDPAGAQGPAPPPGAPVTGRRGLIAEPFGGGADEPPTAAGRDPAPAPRIEISTETARPESVPDVSGVLEALAREIQHEYRRYYGA